MGCIHHKQRTCCHYANYMGDGLCICTIWKLGCLWVSWELSYNLHAWIQTSMLSVMVPQKLNSIKLYWPESFNHDLFSLSLSFIFSSYSRGLDNKVTVYSLALNENVSSQKKTVGTHTSYMSCCTFPNSDQQVKLNRIFQQIFGVKWLQWGHGVILFSV